MGHYCGSLKVVVWDQSKARMLSGSPGWQAVWFTASADDKRWPGSSWGCAGPVFQTYCGFPTFCCLWYSLRKWDKERCMQTSSFHSPNRTDFSPVHGPYDLLEFLPFFQNKKSLLKEMIICFTLQIRPCNNITMLYHITFSYIPTVKMSKILL